MAQTKLNRNQKKQWGQFMTPTEKCEQLLHAYTFTPTDKVLEPSFGTGNFIIALINKFLPLYPGTIPERLTLILRHNLYGVELDPELYQHTLALIQTTYGCLPPHNFQQGDYLVSTFPVPFDYIVGNPPFGGSIDPLLDKELERRYGKRGPHKIKKETYSFFMIKAIESLTPQGTLMFISSDTFLTIKTMKGLRVFLYEQGANQIESLPYFSEETNYPMVVLTHHKGQVTDHIIVDGVQMDYDAMILTDNFSWSIPVKYIKYFQGPKLSAYAVGTGGMTIGKNEYFLRSIKDNTLEEPYEFTFVEEPITVAREREKARLNKLGPKKIAELQAQEQARDTHRTVQITLRPQPLTLSLPHSDYRWYNKAANALVYQEPSTMIYWKDEGDACLTFKKQGNWYLHGVGGLPYFGREGITWQLIASSIKARYLPPGYILDSGAPLLVLKADQPASELPFILGWLLTTKATEILKTVINHTKNIQSKDLERMPYPFWVGDQQKDAATVYVGEQIRRLQAGAKLPPDFQTMIDDFYL